MTASTVCPQCKFDLTLLSRVEELESSLSQARALLRQSFDGLDKRVFLVREECEATLRRAVANETPLAEKSVPVETVTPPPLPVVPPVVATAPKLTAPTPAKISATSGVPAGATEAQFGQKWLLIIGIVIMLLGVGYFLKYSFDRNWISPAVRVAMAYGVGGLLLGLGEWFRRRHENFGLCLAGGGIAALYFSTFAAYEIYDLLPSVVAFGAMIIVTALAGALALKYDTKWLAVLGLVGGFATPWLINTHSNNHVALFTYFTILNAGLLAIAFHKQWRLLNYLGFFFTWSVFTAWACMESFRYGAGTDHFWSGMFFLNVFYLIYTIAPFAVLLKGDPKAKLIGLGLSVPNSLIAFGLSYGMITDYAHGKTWVSLVTLAYAAIQLGLAQVLVARRPESRNPMLIALGQALFFLAITVPILASHQWITICWALQAVLVMWVAQRTRSYGLLLGAVVLGVLAVGRLLFVDYERCDLIFDSLSFSQGYGFHWFERIFAALFVLGSVWFSGWLLKKEEVPFFGEQKWWATVYFSAFGLLLFFVLNVEVGGFFYEHAVKAQFAAISVLWAIFSVALIGLGFVKKLSAVRYTAIGLFALTIIKVFFVDMANVATPFRIISFIVLGLMLIGASFLYYKFRDRLFDGEGK